MKRAIKIAVVALAILFVIAQFFRPDLSNPPIGQGQDLGSAVNVPEDVHSILQRSCNDCHSNNTAYPWYSQISPMSWWLKGHIDDGRRELNFSEWGTYSVQKRAKKLEEICEQVEAREMPLPSYTWVHRDAPLSDAEIKTLCEWTKAESAKMPAAP